MACIHNQVSKLSNRNKKELLQLYATNIDAGLTDKQATQKALQSMSFTINTARESLIKDISELGVDVSSRIIQFSSNPTEKSKEEVSGDILNKDNIEAVLNRVRNISFDKIPTDTLKEIRRNLIKQLEVLVEKDPSKISDKSLFANNKRLNELSEGIKAINPSDTSLRLLKSPNQIGSHSRDDTTGNMSTDMLRDGFTNDKGGKGKVLSDDIEVKLDKKGNPVVNSLLNTVHNFFSRIQSKEVQEKLPELNSTDQTSLNFLTAFNKAFNKILTEASIKYFTQKNTYKNNLEGGIVNGKTDKGDPFGWLIQVDNEGNRYINENFNSLMSMASFNWFATQGRSTLHNNKDAINSILGKPEEEPTTKEARESLTYAGSVRSDLAETLGTIVWKATSLQGKTEIDGRYESRMILSIGEAMITTMLEMNIMEQKSFTSKEMQGFVQDNEGDKVFNPDGATNFVRMKGTLDPVTQFIVPNNFSQKIVDIYGNSPTLIPDLFDIKSFETAPTYSKPKEVSKFLKRTQELIKVPKKLQARVKKLQEIQWETKLELFNIMETLGEDLTLDLMGYNRNINDEHITLQKPALAKNEAILRELTQANDFYNNAKSNNKLSSPFYFAHEVWRNMRVGMVSNTVNPQSKISHRHLFNIKNHNTNVSNETDRNVFKLAVALAFSFSIDKNTAKSAYDRFDQLLEDEVIQKGIAAVKKIKSDKEVTNKTELQQDIIAAVELGGGSIHTLDGLVALGAYSPSENFKTSLGIETDGITNGVIIGLMQSMSEGDMSTALASGGVFFSPEYKDYGDYSSSDPTNFDSYERLAQLWNSNLKELDLEQNKDSFLKTIFKPLAVLNENAELIITEDGRKLSKTPLMTTNYGAGIKKIIKLLEEQALNNFYKTLMDISKSENSKDELARFITNFNSAIAPDSAINPFAIDMPDVNNLKNYVLPFKTERAFTNLISSTYGASLKGALADQFPGFTRFRNVVNSAFKTMFYAFDENYKEQIRLAEEVKSEKAGKSVTLTTEEKTKIINDLLELAPTIKNALSDGISDGLLVMKQSKVKDYSNEGSISQKTAKPIKNTKSVTGKNKGKNTSSVTGSISEIILEEGGVAGLILAIQAIDSAIISEVYDKFDILNVFDAQYASIKGSRSGTELANKAMMDVNTNYSIIEEVTESLGRILTEAAKNKTIYARITDRVRNDDSLKAENYDYNSPRDVFIDVSSMNDLTQENRAENLPKISIMSQYAMPDAGYDVNGDTEITREIATLLKLDEKKIKKESPKTNEQKIIEIIDEISDDITKGSSPHEINFDQFNSTYQETLTGDNSINIFDAFVNEGNVTETVERQNTLKELLTSLVNKVISPLDSTPMQLDVQLNQEGDAVYGAIRDTNIRIQAGQGIIANGSQISAQETLVHELIHAISDYGLGKDGKFPAKLQLQRLFNQVKDVITIEDFLPRDVNGNVIIHTNIRTEFVAAKKRYDYIFNNQEGNNLHEFMAFGLTNEVFGNALNKISATPTRDFKSGTVLERLQEIYEAILDFVSGKIYGTQNLNSNEALQKLTREIVGINDTNKKSLFKYLDIINEVNPILISALTKVIFDPMTKYYKYLKDNQDNIGKVQSGVKNIIGLPVLARESLFNDAVKQIADNIKITESNMFVKLARDVVGVTASTLAWHNLLRFSKKYIDQTRKHLSTNVTKDLQSYFVDGYSKDEAVALNKILLKLDVSSITNKYSLSEVADLLSDSSKLTKEIADTITELDGYNENSNYYIRQANSLGYFIANGKILERNTLLNAYNIATMNYVPNDKIGDVKKAEEIINRLSTLYGISYSTKAHRDSVANLINKENARDSEFNGITYTLNIQQQFKDKSLDSLFQGKKHGVIKGYTSEILNPAIDYKIGRTSDREVMAEAGYYPEAELEYDTFDPKVVLGQNNAEAILYVSKTGLINAQVKTTASLTSRRAKGASLFNEFEEATRVMESAPTIELLNLAVKENTRIASDQFNNRNLPDISKVGNLAVPIVNGKGEITDYRYMMTEQVKDTLLEKDNRFDIVMGKMFGSLIDKVNSVEINKSVIELAKQDFDENFAKTPNKFVRISSDSANQRYKDIWVLMPEQMKKDMREVWGGNEILVKEELIDLIFGYRKISLTNSKLIRTFTQSSMGKVMKADMYMKLTGQIWQEVVAIAKDNIVIKSWVVLKDNIISNNFLLWVKGVPVGEIFKNQAIALKALDSYQTELNKRDNLQRRLDTDTTLTTDNKILIKSKIENLNTNLVSNPVAELIDEGIFQNIIEDIDTEEKTFSLKTKLVDKFTDKTKNYIPSVATEVYKQAYLTKDTFIYKKLLQGTQYSDFIARFTLYQHLTKNKKISKQEAISEIIETFINYDVPSSPELQYLNDMGVLMFTKFLFRIQRVIIKIIKENPANALALESLQGAFGNYSDIMDSSLLNGTLIHRIQNTLLNIPDKATYMGGWELAVKAYDAF